MLVLFGFGSVLIIYAFLWYALPTYMQFFHPMIFIVLGGFALTFVTVVLDIAFKWNTRFYLFALLVGVMIAFVSWKPIEDYLIFKNRQRADKLVQCIDRYKTEYGHYPDSLNYEELKLHCQNVPGNCFIYESCIYEKEGMYYTLSYYTFDGYNVYLAEKGRWVYYNIE